MDVDASDDDDDFDDDVSDDVWWVQHTAVLFAPVTSSSLSFRSRVDRLVSLQQWFYGKKTREERKFGSVV